QDGHRDGQAERLWQERQEDVRHGRQRDALGDELFALAEDRRDLEHERQHEQPEAEGQHDFANEIAIENPQHGRSAAHREYNTPMTNVALLWHMHQPFYEDLITHEHILPWVRLHALKDYYGMASLVRDFPNLRVTFNLVPSLLVQLEAFAADRARDPFLDLSLKPAADLTDADAAFIVRNFFHAQRTRMIDPHARYGELLARRGSATPGSAEARAVARRFSVDDLRDLQVWHKLAWIDPEYQERDGRIRALIAKGRDYSEADKTQLREVELEILNRVVPTYREIAARGQAELSTSPFYHPILPLLCDTDIYRRTHPESRMPRRRFVHPEDALEQLRRAAALHERLF